MKKVKGLSCSARLGQRNGMKIYISEMCAVRLVSASTVTIIYRVKLFSFNFFHTNVFLHEYFLAKIY